MEIGDVYTEHVRGSKYVFNYEGLYYKHASGQRSWWLDVNEETLHRLLDLKGGSGRVIINEKKEMVIYKEFHEEGKKYPIWKPIYAGILKDEMVFDEISIDPKGLMDGLLWPGFNSHHGSRFSINGRGKVFFKEVSFENGVKTIRQFPVRMDDETVVERIKTYKNNGVFFVNEYGHVWAPVEYNDFKKQMDDPEFLEHFNKQWKEMYSKSKRIIQHYMEKGYVSNKKYIPIYAGKYEGDMKVIGRESSPRIIFDEHEFDEL